jgi:hypothetical protein
LINDEFQKLITPSTEDKDNGNEQEEPTTQHEFAGVFQAVKHFNYTISDYNSRKHEEHFSLHNQPLQLNRSRPYNSLSITQTCPCSSLVDIVAYLLKARTVKPAETVIAREWLFKHAHY